MTRSARGDERDLGQVRHLERVRYVAANYDDLQGLTWVPAGLLVLAAWILLALMPGFRISSKFAADILNTAVILIVVLLIIVHLKVRAYYGSRYGRVRSAPHVFKPRRLYGLAVAFVVLAVVYGSSLLIGDAGATEPYLLFPLVLGTVEVIDRWPERRFRTHYLVLGALLMVSGLLLRTLELLRIDYPGGLYPNLLVAYLVLYLVVGGVLDHLLLVRTMKSMPEESGGGAV